MSIPLAFDIGLAALVLAVAVYVVAARETFAAAVGFLTYGLLLALVWVRLSAVDVALTEASIGGGVTGVLILLAAARVRRIEMRPEPSGRPGPGLRLVAAILSAAIAGALAALVLMPVDPAPTLAAAAVANLPATGVGNPVTAVLMAYRAWDTLLEKVVLMLALVGVWSLAPDALWGGHPGPRYQAPRDGALVFLAQVLLPLGIAVGIYLTWVGADAPGGAFPGSTVIAAMWLLTMMAGLRDAPAVSRRGLRLALVAGAAVFLAVGLAGVGLAGAFLAYPPGYAKPLILGIEAALVLSVAATLALLVAGPPARASRP